MRGAGGAPRGPRAYQKPLRRCNLTCELTRHQKQSRKQDHAMKHQKDKKKRTGITGSRQANQIGGCRAKRTKKQASCRPERLTNIFSSNHQNSPEDQENFSQGHQNRPAIDRQPPSTTGTAHAGIEECNRQSARGTGQVPLAQRTICASHSTTVSEAIEKSKILCLRGRVSALQPQTTMLPLPTSKGAHLSSQIHT